MLENSPEKIKAIIIDDEERAISTLRSLLELYVPDIEVVATRNNVPEGVLAINKYNPRVVFLDIEMPEYNGFELIGFFKNIDFEIIFVTAYNEYAIKAFEVSAIDYLLKPVDIDKLKNAVDKVRKKIGPSDSQTRIELLRERLNGTLFTKVALPMANELRFQEISEIVYLEADGSYTKIWLKDNSNILVSKKLKIFEDIFIDHPLFFRSHRSFIININHIKKYSKSESMILMDNDKSILIARERKMDFEKQLKDNNISLS